jgi:hypothetical protein
MQTTAAGEKATSIEELTLQELISIRKKLGWFQNLTVLVIIVQIIVWFLSL